ncbi:WD40 repeat-containing protein [Handroanthus impetiginosus]|uniref:WD40 repeat-containing protein n=1 Tax=Handroanthus impetiginosus TaxID=429701 RepID=A0A2G9H384_9LAMI|nr:WD40 repeat-containing protein [Handroanthus impetiginosus]
MNRRTLTMNFDALGAEDEDDSFFESYERLSSVAPMDLASGSDDDDFEDSRMSFASAISSASIKRIYSVANSSSILPSYDMWMTEPGDVQERRKRLLQGMGLLSRKDFVRLASSKSKIVRTISRKPEPVSKPKPEFEPKPEPDATQDSTTKGDSSSTEESTGDEPSPTTTIVLVRSRSDGDIDAFSTKTKQRKEELIGPISKQKLIRTSSGQFMPTTGVCQYTSAVRDTPIREKNRSSLPSNEVAQSVLLDGAFGSFFLIKNLDTGKDFIVKEYNEDGLWNKLNDVQTGKQLTMEEFEKSVGYSPVVMDLMRRMSRNGRNGGGKFNQNSYFSKSFRNSKKKGAAILKNIKGVATSVSGLLVDKELENSSPVDQKVAKNTSPWVEAHQHGKSYKELTALHLSQEIQAHEGSIWTIEFTSDGRFLASAGEDRMIHIWEVQECEVMSTKAGDDSSSGGSTPIHSAAGNVSDRPPLAEITPMPSEMRRKGRTNTKKGNSIPDYVNVPETVLALSEKPICTFKGHQEDVLDLAWSKSQFLLSSSMDKTVRMWDLETKSCLKMFAHNDYVTCIQFNPVDENYFISGSLDAKVRIWSVPERKVVDWTDVHEMVTAASYTPDGQGAIIGCQEGSCRLYTIDDGKLEHRIDIQKKKKTQAKKLPPFVPPQAKKLPGFQSQSGPGKITGFQFAPWNPSEVLITSADSRIGIYNESELIQKFRGFRNTSSQISACFSPDGKHVISASEDSQVYIWKVEETKNPVAGKRRSTVTVHAHEHFHCKDVTVAIPWPGSVKNEPPCVEIHSKRHSKRITAPPTPNSTTDAASPSREDNLVGASGRKHLPPLPKKKNDASLERNTSCADEDFAESGRIDPGIGVSESFSSSSASIRYGDSPSISASGTSQSWSSSDGASGGNIQTIQATAWGLAILTASLEGEIRVYQNFGLPLKVSRQTYLF